MVSSSIKHLWSITHGKAGAKTGRNTQSKPCPEELTVCGGSKYTALVRAGPWSGLGKHTGKLPQKGFCRPRSTAMTLALPCLLHRWGNGGLEGLVCKWQKQSPNLALLAPGRSSGDYFLPCLYTWTCIYRRSTGFSLELPIFLLDPSFQQKQLSR